MATQNPYQRLIGWVFMVMFLFIATPVQLWHHHPPEDGSHTIQTTIHAVTQSVHGHCDVCEHQYALFLQEDAAWQLLTPQAFTVLADTQAPVCLCSFLGLDANKGPPVKG